MYEKFYAIDTFIFDVDGVMTDGSILVTEAGELLRAMNVRDGFALQYALQQGFKIIVITGGNSQGVTFRLQKLGIKQIYAGISDKLSLLLELQSKGYIDFNSCTYMGDDMPDLKAMQQVLLPAAPKNAISDILAIAKFISSSDGGKGCVRELIEKTLKVQGKWLISADVNALSA